ncbi:MAG TPA: right-handed parallel beta-helix repeat-containing protein [Candidatus Paceibacterota bacterium]|nr:right-handed parallel beta-helix repeat-containing protein [Candidatus Paceibacterota bacterium]
MKTRLNLITTAMLLAAAIAGSAQSVVTNQPQTQVAMSPVLRTSSVVLDNFDDNKLTKWVTHGPGQLALFETNQQFTVWGYWPGVHTRKWEDSYCWGMKASNWSLVEGQTSEWRIDVVRMNEFATASELVVASSANGVFYGSHLGRNFVTIVKWPVDSMAVFSCETLISKHTNVVLTLSLTRDNPNVIVTVRVLDKDHQNAVRYERSVVDTPQVDRTLSSAQVLAASGMNLACGTDKSGPPYTSGDYVGCAAWQYSDGTSRAAEVTYDNLELWTYRLPTAHYVDINGASPTPPYTNWATAATRIQDAVDTALPGDEIVVANGLYATGGRTVGTNLLVNRVAVDKPLTLRSLNGPQFTVIQGYQVPGTTNGDGAIRCVYLANGASLAGFTLTNGATRTDGLPDREQSGGGIWCESTNALVSNCNVIGNSASSHSGGVDNGTLYYCTLSGNSASGFGGGACGGTLDNCALTGNSAGVHGGGAVRGRLNHCTLSGNSAGIGGGVSGSTLNNCTLAGNSAELGGGAAGGTLNHCTLIGNSASYGGGASYGVLGSLSTLKNCIVYFNTATHDGNYYGEQGGLIALNYCCTTPTPTNGVGNITHAPLFVDYAGGNLRLQSDSPCINAGNNAYTSSLTDLDGLPRLAGGTVDIGAYEFQGTGSVISYAWLQQYGLPTDGSVDATDADADGLNTWQEWRCQTDPTTALSVLRLLSPMFDGTNVTVIWESVSGVNYSLERGTNLAPPSLFTPLVTNLRGQPGTTSFTDTNAAGVAPLFYRLGVQ